MVNFLWICHAFVCHYPSLPYFCSLSLFVLKSKAKILCRFLFDFFVRLGPCVGQGIAVMNHVLPDVYTEVLSVLQDKAGPGPPSNSGNDQVLQFGYSMRPNAPPGHWLLTRKADILKV